MNLVLNFVTITLNFGVMRAKKNMFGFKQYMNTIQNNTHYNKQPISFKAITPEHLFIRINGFGRDEKWAKEMVDVIDISRKDIQKGQGNVRKLVNHVAKRYKEYFLKINKTAWFGCSRFGRITTPIRGRYGGYTQRANALVDKISERVTTTCPKRFIKIKKEFPERMESSDFEIKADIHTMSYNSGGKSIPLTSTYRIFGFPKGVEVHENDIGTNDAFLWSHTDAELIPRLLEELQKVYQSILKAKDESVEEVTSKIAQFHWLFAQTAPFGRGSAGVADVLSKSLFEAKRIQVSPWVKDTAPDLEALTTPLENFREKYIDLFEEKPRIM